VLRRALVGVDGVLVVEDRFELGDWVGVRFKVYSDEGKVASVTLLEEGLEELLKLVLVSLEVDLVELSVVNEVLSEVLGEGASEVVSRIRGRSALLRSVEGLRRECGGDWYGVESPIEK